MSKNKVCRRASYSIIKNEKDSRAKELHFAKMLLNNPKALIYFKDRSRVSKPFVRIGEILRMVISSEQHRRKEEIRSALYAFCEQFMGEGKLKHVNMNARVLSLLGSVRNEIENDSSLSAENKREMLEVLDAMVSGKIDTHKILKDKEWYRGMVKLLAAAGVLAGAVMAVPPSEIPEEDYVLRSEYDKCMVQISEMEGEFNNNKENLNTCTRRLNNCNSDLRDYEMASYILARNPQKCPKNNDKKLKRELANANKKIGELNNMLNELKKQIEAKNSSEKSETQLEKKFKLLLMEKVDYIFKSVMQGESDESYYQSSVRDWFEKKINDNDNSAIALVIYMGGELLYQEVDEGRVTKLTPLSPNNLEDALDEDRLTYPGSTSNGAFNRRNSRPGNVKALFDVYKQIYDRLNAAVKNE